MLITDNKKPGVSIGEYGCNSGCGVDASDSNPILGWIEPACKHPDWIMWFMANGDAVLYTGRDPSGAVDGDPIRLTAARIASKVKGTLNHG